VTRIQGDILDRTLLFAETVVELVDSMATRTSGAVIGRQLARAGTSIGANVHEADAAFSESDFIYSMNVARKEALEARYWLQLARRTKLIDATRAETAIREATELIKILTTIVRKSQQRRKEYTQTHKRVNVPTDGAIPKSS